jgi:hypothetical protein
VKEYSGATANIFTAVFCSFLFPEKFKVGNFLFFVTMQNKPRDDVVYSVPAPPGITGIYFSNAEHRS